MESFPLLNGRPLRGLTSQESPRGFTLVEMLVVLAIISILAVVVIVGEGNFDKSLTITDTAYSIALSIREAQTFGLSSKTYTSVSNTAYGVHFSAATPGSYLLFADIYPAAPGLSSAYCPGHTAAAGSPDAKPGNCTYDAAGNELVQNFAFTRGFTIASVCGRDSASVAHCTSGGAGTPITALDIVFLRPNTDSVVVGLTGSGDIALSDAQIQLSSPQGGSRYICVSSVGQVSVATSTCP